MNTLKIKMQGVTICESTTSGSSQQQNKMTMITLDTYICK